MPVTEIGDPRLQALFGNSEPQPGSVLPTIQLPRKGLPPAVLATIALMVAIILFVVLNERRTRSAQAEVIVPDAGSGATSWAPPPLYVPPQPITSPAIVTIEPRPALVAPAVAPAPQAIRPQIIYQPQPIPQQLAPPVQPPPARTSAGAPLVIDTGSSSAGPAAGSGAANMPGWTSGGVSRIRASNFANRSMTVPQGTLIPAVLESGFNSTQPGFARAVVSRDVRGFDGKNVLVPRGSRLIGEYRSDVAQGQRRAVISWSRLIRPDGKTIGLDSPAVDTLGRGGVAASVNTHFIERLGDALLQSTIGIGTALAGRAASGPVVIVPQNAAAATAQLIPSNNWVPTLTVPAGKSISVFVAHDLDFGAEPARQ